MSNLFSRRRVIQATGGAVAAAGLIPFAEWFDREAQAKPPITHVRRNANTAAGAAMLAIYKSAVGTMMSKGMGDPCAWQFQWYTHQIQSNMDKAATIATLPSTQQPLATDMWNTCQAHFGRPLQYFLPWHRMYVFFLERIVRQVSGHPEFALPYWDYMTPAYRPIPGPFRTDPSSPLYRAQRNNGSGGTANVNGGQPIDYGQPPNTLNLDCMKQTSYLPTGSEPGFCSAINQNPHGLVHTLTGNGQNMGSVPWAAGDPVFWAHHCEIDRLWAGWNAAGNANPTQSSWLNQQFVFADEKCQKVVVSVNDFKAIGPLGYTYDRLPGAPLLGIRDLTQRLRLIATVRRAGPHPDPGPERIRLGGDQVTLRLAPPAGERPLALNLRGAIANNARAHTKVQVRVTDLQAEVQPGILYHVYLNLPQGARGAAAQSHFLGAITFFDAVMPEHAQMDHMDHMKGGEGPTFTFDATAVVARLGAVDNLSVTIVPAGRPADGAAPSIGNVEVSVAE